MIGAGFGGLEAAQHLARVPGLMVTVLDRHKYHLFQPPLYQVATTALSPNDIASSIRAVFAREQQVDVLMEEVTGIDLVTRHVLCH